MADLQKIMKWFACMDTGLSSKAIASHMISGWCDGSYPHDPADLGRCLRLLECFPEWKDRISEMAVYGPCWERLAGRWHEVEASMIDEVGINWEKDKRAPQTYRLMKEVMGK